MPIVIGISVQPLSEILAIGSTKTFSVVASASGGAVLNYQWYKDSSPIDPILNSTATTKDLVLANIAQEDSNIYYCILGNNLDKTTARTDYGVLASSILDYIELNMKTLILSMSVANGYNFDWQTVDEENEAIGSFPRAFIESPMETNIDTAAGANASAYTNDVLFIIRVKGEQGWTDNPQFTIRSCLRLAIDDLKKLFKDSVNDSCDEILYRSHQVIYNLQNDIQRPAYVRSQWLCKYTQDRTNPILYSA